MNVEEFRDYCLSLPGVAEKMPFTTVNDPYSRDVLCFYAGSKWFFAEQSDQRSSAAM